MRADRDLIQAIQPTHSLTHPTLTETMVWSRGHACGPPFPPVWGHVSCAIGEAAALIHGGETAWDAGRAARNDVYMLLGFGT